MGADYECVCRIYPHKFASLWSLLCPVSGAARQGPYACRILEPSRCIVYRCIESMLNVEDVENSQRALVLLYGVEAVRQAEALLDRSERFFGLDTLGADMQGSAMHQTLLAAYDKLFADDDAIAA